MLFIKRLMHGVGYAGGGDDVFYRDHTMLLLAATNKMVEDTAKSLGEP